ncbi:MAG: DUF2391 family protein [Campylobacterota bacterium]|nr:DUF2391 family protein [Campylobacterota bacterium]
MNLNLNFEDIGQIIIGAFALAVPISFSEEAWRLGETLPWGNLILLFTLSIAFLGLYAYQSVFQANLRHRHSVFVLRIIIAYLVTLLVVALILLALNKFPILDDPVTAIKRLIVIAMPASMGAIIVDGFDKE